MPSHHVWSRLAGLWLILSLAIGAGPTPRAAAADAAQPLAAPWPQFRGPGGQGVSRDQKTPTTWSDNENVVWKTELPGPGASSPTIIGGRIYLTCYSGYNVPGDDGGRPEALRLHLVALNRDGKILGKVDIEPRLPEQESIREGHGYATSTPAADNDRVYAFFGKSGVLAFDHRGKQLWRTTVGEGLNGWGSAASPVLYEDLVIINASVESESLVALDAATGREVWRAGGIKESWNTPILVTTADGRTELVMAVFQKILGFDPATGKPLWSCDTDINWYMAPSLVAHGDVVYSVGGRSGGGLAVRAGGKGDVTDTHRLWTIGKGSNVTSPVLHEGRLYWMHESLGIAYCAEASTGEIVYEERVRRGGQVYASPVLADGKLYYVARHGATYVLPAQPRFEILAVNNLEQRGMFNASPAVADNRLYLRSNRYLYCLGEE